MCGYSISQQLLGGSGAFLHIKLALSRIMTENTLPQSVLQELATMATLAVSNTPERNLPARFSLRAFICSAGQ
ncbi:MAG: hypothetical protein ACJAVI_002778 [Candidatus Azotimanducaceae bacterium]